MLILYKTINISKILSLMTKKLERVRKVRKKDFDKMVESLLKTPPPKNQKEEKKKEEERKD